MVSVNWFDDSGGPFQCTGAYGMKSGRFASNGPWGGGNSFFKGLSKYLISKGNTVVTDLRDNDVDVILLADPRRLTTTSINFNSHFRWYELIRRQITWRCPSI